MARGDVGDLVTEHARELVLRVDQDQQAARHVAGEQAAPRSDSEAPQIPLWPLYVVLVMVLLVAWANLLRAHYRSREPDGSRAGDIA